MIEKKVLLTISSTQRFQAEKPETTKLARPPAFWSSRTPTGVISKCRTN